MKKESTLNWKQCSRQELTKCLGIVWSVFIGFTRIHHLITHYSWTRGSEFRMADALNTRFTNCMHHVKSLLQTLCWNILWSTAHYYQPASDVLRYVFAPLVLCSVNFIGACYKQKWKAMPFIVWPTLYRKSIAAEISSSGRHLMTSSTIDIEFGDWSATSSTAVTFNFRLPLTANWWVSDCQGLYSELLNRAVCPVSLCKVDVRPRKYRFSFCKISFCQVGGCKNQTLSLFLSCLALELNLLRFIFNSALNIPI